MVLPPDSKTCPLDRGHCRLKGRSTRRSKSPSRQDIKQTGFYRNKAKSIQGAGRVITEEYGGKVPQTMKELLRVPGAARKTANVVLGSWYGIAVGVVVDTHVIRLANRLGLVTGTDAEKIEYDLHKIVEMKYWTKFSHWLISHGLDEFARRFDSDATGGSGASGQSCLGRREKGKDRGRRESRGV